MLFVVSRGQSREFLRDLIQPLSSSGDGGFFMAKMCMQNFIQTIFSKIH